MNWQPIETAPKDGSWVVLYFNRWSDPVLARWHESTRTAKSWWDVGSDSIEILTCGYCGGTTRMEGTPSHWHQLPAPPTKDQP